VVSSFVKASPLFALQITSNRVIFLYNLMMDSMMYTTVLRKVGGSVMLAVPPALLDVLHLAAGAKVGLAVDGGRLVVAPAARPRYTIDELLAQCDASAPISAEDREWLDAGPVGGGLL
jgi:antitoxin ChpS